MRLTLSQKGGVRGPHTRINSSYMLVVFATLLLALQPGTSHAASNGYKRNLIKTAFVFNIAKFVTWPDDIHVLRPQTLRICFYRKDFLQRAFSSIEGKRVRKRLVESQTIEHANDSAACDVVLVPQSQLARFEDESAPQAEHPTLVIADLTSMRTSPRAFRGVTMNLVRQGKSIGFEVNLSDVKQRGLSMSSELLKLARIINTEH
ncbi:YfiR family protein [Pontibacterium granulatum]|uniref:YfiR family protein n=1 Tax=Pontibacterium granulatum TaxID=2036029 RepID=UPI002499DB1A|nr:YfiR family protein [Pontibacterium granulatum]MDI3326522.1 YfiR family protein [Pontibacterium granulatum]